MNVLVSRFNRLMLKSLGVAAALGIVAMVNALPAVADSVTYTTSLQSSNMCTGCGPFGTVTVSSVSGHPNEVAVSLTLTPGEVFANTGAGAALLFDVQGNPTLTVSGLTSAFSFVQPTSPIMADGSGQWNTEILCDVCGSGTSPPQDSGPINFILAVASGTLAPSSFVTNNKNVLFASDLGVPNGSGGFFTGDVVTKNGLTPVPLPAAAWLMISALAGLFPWARKRHAA
jgi:hypothetical protein